MIILLILWDNILFGETNQWDHHFPGADPEFSERGEAPLKINVTE